MSAAQRVHHISEACSAQAYSTYYRQEGQLQPSLVYDQRLRHLHTVHDIQHSALSTQHWVQAQVQVQEQAQIAPLTQQLPPKPGRWQR